MRRSRRSGAVSRWAYAAWTVAAVLACCAPWLVSKARACGGFWCSQQAPVNQSGERIVFVDHPDGTVSALIEIRYSGPSERFAWLIPVPGDPDITIASSTAIQRLDDATAPSYQLKPTVNGTCKEGPDIALRQSAGRGGASGSADGGVSAPAVMVVDSGSVGPYDYATIAVAPKLDDPASAALMWFRENGYDFSSLDGELLRPYLQEGLHLLAFKLTKSAQTDVGAIRPVIIHYPGDLPMIPIRPTAVAANPDMGVLVWIAGDHRAVPANYKSLVLDEALIDWFNPRRNYDAVVTRAADEAGGQGFVTELAGASDESAKAVFSQEEAAQLRELEAGDYPEGLDALWAANGLFRNWDGWRDAVAAAVTLPEGVTLDQFAINPDSYRDIAQVSTEALFAALHEKVVDPVVAVQRLLAERPYLTRLYTTMSPAEMTMDPMFTFNADLENVSNLHVAKLVISCNASVTEAEAPWRIALPQGDAISGQGDVWPFAVDALPANRRIEQLAEQGQPKVVEDNSQMISAALRQAGSSAASGSSSAGDSSGDSGCAVSDGVRSNRQEQRSLFAFALLALVLARRKRSSLARNRA